MVLIPFSLELDSCSLKVKWNQANCGRFANESFRQLLVRQRLRSIRQRPKSPCQRPTGQFANVRYLVLTEKKLLIDVCFGEN